MGQFNPSLIALSMSSLSATPSQKRATASFRAGIRMRLTMNPGLSFFTKTVSFLILWAVSIIASIVSLEVLIPLITSTSCMSWGGLKKCMPQTFSGLLVRAASCVMLIELVFEAMIACLGAHSSTSLKVGVLISILSGTASITRSASLAASSKLSVGCIRSMICFASPLLSWPLLSNFSKLVRIIFIPLSRNRCSTSLSVTW